MRCVNIITATVKSTVTIKSSSFNRTQTESFENVDYIMIATQQKIMVDKSHLFNILSRWTLHGGLSSSFFLLGAHKLVIILSSRANYTQFIMLKHGLTPVIHSK